MEIAIPQPPPPVITGFVDEPRGSPLGDDLMMRKVTRQMQRPTPRLSVHSPQFQERLKAIAEGVDATAESSPIGAALLQRRMQRQGLSATASSR